MTPTQEQEMQKKFEAWALTLSTVYNAQGYNIEKRHTGKYISPRTIYLWKGFQAAYTPKPNIEKVADAIWEAHGQIDRDDCIPLAQAAINSIFNQ